MHLVKFGFKKKHIFEEIALTVKKGNKLIWND